MRRADIDKELPFHIDARVADLVASGASPDEARRQALVEFGGVVQTTEAVCVGRTTREREGGISRSATERVLQVFGEPGARPHHREAPAQHAARRTAPRGAAIEQQIAIP